MLRHLFVTAFVVVTFGVNVSGNIPKLNVPRVLLPLVEEGAFFRMYANGGCFTWKSTRPDIIVVTPIPDSMADGVCSDPSFMTTPTSIPSEAVECSTSALVSISGSLVNSAIGKTQAMVMAEDFYSPGLVLRAEVIVDRIHNLQILTKTHELYLEEAPEEFVVKAYDENGNDFSTLDGIIFKWMISSGNVRFIKFSDSSYAHDPLLEKIEAKGQQGSKVLLEGHKTGSARVSVHLASKASYATAVEPTEVNVLVVANLFLMPAASFVMFGANVNYHAEQIKSNKIHKIDLTAPSQYFLDVADKSLVSIDAATAVITAGSELGSTKVFLRDTNVADVEVKSPTAELHVVDPDHISIEIEPRKNWNVIVGRQYDISIDIFDADNRKLFPSSNIVSRLEFLQPDYFSVIETTTNGTWLTGLPLKAGTVQIRATLIGTRTSSGSVSELDVHLTASAIMEIFDEIQLIPERSVFPWDPASSTAYPISYSLNGGSSPASFIWASSNTSITTVTQNGIAKIRRHLIGDALVTASMSRAHHNFGSATVRVLPAIALDIADDHALETEVGSILSLPVAVFAANNVAFTHCDEMSLDVNMKETKTFSVSGNAKSESKEDRTNGCTVLSLNAAEMGFSNVQASYSYVSPDNPSKRIHLKDEATVAAYKPLLPVQPASSSVLLAIDSSYTIVWSGGPLPWIHEPRSHFVRLESVPSDSNVASFSTRATTTTVAGSANYIFHVTCKKVGTLELVLTVGNAKSTTLPRPVHATSTVTIHCGKPDKVKLEARVPTPTETSCPPMAKSSGTIPALCTEPLPIFVEVFDASGNKFDNISTFDIAWTVSNTELATLPAKGVEAVVDTGESFALLDTKGKVGSVEVSGKLKTSDSYLIGGFGSISDTLFINLVNDAVITPDEVNIFNHPKNAQHLSIHHGSGFFEVLDANNNIVSHKYNANNQTITVTPMTIGTAVVTVRDLCLVSRKSSPSAKIHVSGIESVELLVADKVQQGKSIVAQVRILDHQGQPVPQDQLQFLNVQVLPSSPNILKLQPKPDPAPEEVHFVVEGSQLGLTMLTAHVSFGNRNISSSQAPVQVFPPLTLEPRNITLIIGAKFQVQVIGGPQQSSDSTIEFSMGNTKIASPNGVGLITALTLGSTRLTARVSSMDGSKRVTFSEDSVQVHVVKFEGVRIRAPVMLVRSGTEMPLQAVGLDVDNQNAFSYGSLRPNLHFTWSVSDRTVGDVVSVFHRKSITNTNTGVTRFFAKKTGRVLVKVRVAITASQEASNQFQLDRDREFSDEIEIQVIEPLELRAPRIGSNLLLMSPRSSFQLQTNRDFGSGVRLAYNVVNTSTQQPAVTVDSSGLVVAGQKTGTCLIEVTATEAEHAGLISRISIEVEVKPVNFVMINAVTTFKAKSSMYLPKGITLNLDVSYHDNLASRFHAVNNADNLTFRPNRFDSNKLVQANSTLSIELTKMTETVLRVARPSTSLADFVIFDTRTAFSPNVKKVTSGDVILISSLISGLDGDVTSDGGEWISEPAGIVSIDDWIGSANGLAVAQRPGQARISRIFDNDVKISLDLDIEPATRVVFRKLSADFAVTNVIDRAHVVYFSVLPVSGDAASVINFHATSVVTQKELLMNDDFVATQLFECQASFLTPRMEFSKVFELQAGFFIGEQSYGCRLKPIMADATVFFSSEIELAVRPASGQLIGGQNSHVQGDTVNFFFYSFFKVLTPELRISNVGKKSDAIILGLPAVLDSISAQVSDPDLFHVGRPTLAEVDADEAADATGRYGGEPVDKLIIPVTVKPAYWKSPSSDASSKFTLVVTCSKTSQSKEIPLRVVLDDRCPDNVEPGWTYLLSLLFLRIETFVVTAVCCFFAWIYTLKQKSAATSTPGSSGTAPTAPASGGIASPFLNGTPNGTSQPSTPYVSNSHFFNAESRPYLWTADNSPIYGSPNGRQSPPYPPRRSPRPLAQYSYTNN